MIEILAPCGSKESLIAAINTGADAVFLGLEGFSARRTAENFDEQGLIEACTLCHKNAVKVYLTLNTLVFDREIEDVKKAIISAAKAGVDAIIVQDFAVLSLIKAMVPDMPIHGSTQMTINSLEAANFAKKLGMSRVVLGRELSFEQIKHIADNTDIELEVFVHGALCVCVSGQCYMSAALGERSANRGLCAQPCRLNFSNGNQSHVLSLKDNSLIEYLPELQALGVVSAKIEGRLKRAEYVAAAVTACKQALNGDIVDTKRLQDAFSRGGFTDGYYVDDFKNMLGIRTKSDVSATQSVLSEISTLYKDNYKRYSLAIDVLIKANQPVKVRGTVGSITVEVVGDIPQIAQKKALDKDTVQTQLEKLGGTAFLAGGFSLDLDENLFLPASVLNGLRRQLVATIEEEILAQNTPKYHVLPYEILRNSKPTKPKKFQYRCEVRTKAQLKQALTLDFAYVYAPIELLPDGEFDEFAEKIIVVPPVFLGDCEAVVLSQLKQLKSHGFDKMLCHTIGHFSLAFSVGMMAFGGYRLNITNSLAFRFYEELGAKDLMVSVEETLSNSRWFPGTIEKGVFAYGRLPLMITRRSPVSGEKPQPSKQHHITDRLGNQLPILNSNVAEILNPDVLSLSDKAEDLKHFDFAVLFFTDEKDIAEILSFYQNNQPFSQKFTRGVYFRGVK